MFYRECCQIVKPRCVEPIYQASRKQPQTKRLSPLSNKCADCLKDYFDNNLRQSYCQIFHEQQETLEMGRPTAVVTSPRITIDDEQMMHMQNDALSQLENDKDEIRKKFGIMHMDDRVYILGGYVVDKVTREKKAPSYDFFYDNTSKELVRIPTVPGYGRMGFGLAATEDDKIIIVGGHNFDYETMQNVTMLDTQAQDLKWEDLPEMPNGTIGPGVSVIDNVLYAIGGFDFIGREILCHGDVLSMNLDDKQWKTLADLDPPRARPLISIADHIDPPSLIVAGGYNFDRQGKAIPYGKIEEYDREKRQWNEISTIPNFRTSNALATKTNTLFLMGTSKDTGEPRVLSEYNLETREWKTSDETIES